VGAHTVFDECSETVYLMLDDGESVVWSYIEDVAIRLEDTDVLVMAVDYGVVVQLEDNDWIVSTTNPFAVIRH